MRLRTLLIGLWLSGCNASPNGTGHADLQVDSNTVMMELAPMERQKQTIRIPDDVLVNHYFEVMDSVCRAVDSTFGIQLTEYELVHGNRWILDSLMSFDYYTAQERGIFIADQKLCRVLKAGDVLEVPDTASLNAIRGMLRSIRIDVNIPEYTLRILQDDSLLHQCLVRVGKNERKYLALAGHEVDLRTPVGEGRIVRIERDPLYINPVDGHRYKTTRRDDDRYTQLPRIPFLEPEINGVRTGALIHPTTNRSTLGRAISNGCVGLSEADAWMVYYHAPLGTSVRFRYDLNAGERELKDIYSSLGNSE